MARKPLPNDLAALHLLLSQLGKFLGPAETFRDKIRMQQSMIGRAMEGHESLVESEIYASHLKEEVAKAGAALVIPSKLLSEYLDKVEGCGDDDVAEDQELVRAPEIPTGLAEKYHQLGFGVRSLGEQLDRYIRLAGEILVKLGEVEGKLTVTTPELKVDFAHKLEVFLGLGISVDETGLAFFKAIYEARGHWLSSKTLQTKGSILESHRLHRVREKLPPILRALVEAQPGKGFRLKTESLA